jgi:hypothetical protein
MDFLGNCLRNLVWSELMVLCKLWREKIRKDIMYRAVSGAASSNFWKLNFRKLEWYIFNYHKTGEDITQIFCLFSKLRIFINFFGIFEFENLIEMA